MSTAFAEILSNPIGYLKGVGPQRAEWLSDEIGVRTFQDLLEYFPFRYLDKSTITPITSIVPGVETVLLAGKLGLVREEGEGRTRRLVSDLNDGTGILKLVWFQGVTWLKKNLKPGFAYLVYGKISFFNGQPQLTHPEMESPGGENGTVAAALEPIYSSTEKLRSRGLGGRDLGRLTRQLLNQVRDSDIKDFLPVELRESLGLLPRPQALRQIHFPADSAAADAAIFRLKFDELFIDQIRTGMAKTRRHQLSRGVVFSRVGDLFNRFYSDVLPFALTGAQKRVIREIRQDTATGRQMNRLLQGDVGSGKTMVALLALLLAVDNGFQGCLLAPTEILSRQHAQHFEELLKTLPVKSALLTGSVKSAARKKLLADLASGEIKILIGTHAVLEDNVVFQNLGLAIIDEQHRFGVAQRAKLWQKASIPPHVLVMTATPIPRTLAMTAYNDLDYSIIDELPPGRQPVRTVQRYEYDRPAVMDFVKEEIRKGRQTYIIFPLIEESATLDYENLMKGYENVKAYFPEPPYYISMVHGRQKADIRQTNMKRFVEGDTAIMVGTTVIEVGVNVPNASVMIIESAEKFGLSQLHQLRGRVGRGSDQSYCILIAGNKSGASARERLKIMCDTTDGFKIAEKDMELRGPGDISGTRQSGLLDYKLADIVRDKPILQLAIGAAERLLGSDPELSTPVNAVLRSWIFREKGKTAWSKIS